MGCLRYKSILISFSKNQFESVKIKKLIKWCKNTKLMNFMQNCEIRVEDNELINIYSIVYKYRDAQDTNNNLVF